MLSQIFGVQPKRILEATECLFVGSHSEFEGCSPADRHSVWQEGHFRSDANIRYIQCRVRDQGGNPFRIIA